MRLFLLAFLIAATAWAELKVDGPSKVPANKLVRLAASGAADGAGYIWDCDREDAIDAEESGPRFLFTGPPGVYRFKVRSVLTKDGRTVIETVRLTVTIGDDPPPTPPAPPTPPGPADPLTAALQVAYAADADADRAKSLAFLAAAYKGMAAQAPGRPDLKTNAQWVAWMKTVVEAPGVGLTPAQVHSLRSAVAAELSRAWGATAAPLSAADAAAELSKIAAAMEGVR